MKKLVLMMALICVNVFGDQSQTLSADERDLLVQIVNHIQNMPTITSVNLDVSVDRNVEDYLEQKRWLERDYAELLKINPAIDSYQVGGMAFSNILLQARMLIAKNDAVIAAAKNSRPDKKAIEAIETAILMGNAGTKQLMLFKQNQSRFDTLQKLYGFYTAGKSKAADIDPRILEYKKSEIVFCEENFVEPFLILKKERDEAALKKQAAADAERRQKEIERKQLIQKKMDYAKSRGFKNGFYTGIFCFVEELADEGIKLSEAPTYLIEPAGSDDYTMQSLDSKFVYFCDEYDGKLLQIALIREPNKVYQQGSYLPDGKYQFVKFDDFVTALGTGVQIPIFKRYDY